MSLSFPFPSDNPFFTGGFSLALLGGSFALFRRGWTLSLGLARRYCLSSLEITSKDRSFPWVLHWLAKQGMKTQSLSVETSFVGSSGKKNEGAAARAVFGFVPGPGVHVVTYGKKWISVERTREHQSTDMTSGKPWEKVVLTILGKNSEVFRDLLDEAFLSATQQQEGKTIIYTNWGAEWRPFGEPRKHRPLGSVVLDKSVAEDIIDDIKDWKESMDWYIDRGIPYRRGYLLHGPPGSGKSSFITAVAGHFNLNICILNLAESGLTDDRLALALSTVPPQSVVLLEDIDAAFMQREAGNSFSRLTFSGLLNALDGVASAEERLVFMTTNHMDRLDDALIRPGRVDKVVYLGNATFYQLEKMFATFFPDAQSLVQVDPVIRIKLQDARMKRTAENASALPNMAEEFAYQVMELVGANKVTMAQLQGYLLLHKRSAADAFIAIANLKNDAKTPTPNLSRNERSVSKLFSEAHRLRGLRVGAADIDKMFFNPQSS